MTAEPVRKVAAYLPVSRELLADAAPFRRAVEQRLRMGMSDASFAAEVGRSPLTDASAIVMWRRWWPRKPEVER